MIHLTPKQSYAFHRAQSGLYDFIMYGGAIKGAKSVWLLATDAYNLSQYPKSRAAFIRKDMPTIEKNTYPALEKLMDMGLRKKVVGMKGDVLRFANGSEYIFMGENYERDKELTRFSGLDLNWISLDEMNEISEATFWKCFERAGTWVVPGLSPEMQPRPIVKGTCNPNKAWPKRLIYEPHREGKLRPNWLYIHARIDDNPHIPVTFKEQLKNNLPPLLYSRYVDGDWDAFEATNAFCTAFSRDRHIAECFIEANRDLYLSIDFNLQPFGLVASQRWYDNDGHHVRYVNEISIENGSIPEMIRQIKENFQPWFHRLKLTGDAMGRNRDLSQRDNASYYEQIMRGLGLRESQIYVPGANPTHENSRSDTNYVFYHHPDLKISPRCTNTIRDLESVEVDDHGKIKKKNRKHEEQRADMLDCVRYDINSFMAEWIDRHQKMSGLSSFS